MIRQTDARKRGRSSKRKGADAERELANLLQTKGLLDVRRGYVYAKEPDLVGIKGIHPEVKRVEKLNIEKAMTQAIEDSKKFKDGSPTVFHRRDHGDWLVTMRLDDWLEIYRGREYEICE